MIDSYLTDYENPPLELSERCCMQDEDFDFKIRAAIHSEFIGPNVGGYCTFHHSVETRTTKSKNLVCSVLIDGTDIKGKDFNETFDNLRAIAEEAGNTSDEGMLELFFRRIQEKGEKRKQ